MPLRCNPCWPTQNCRLARYICFEKRTHDITAAPHAARLKALRTLMKAKGSLAAVIVPRQDEFQGEYVAPYAERLQWLTGFKGSWGVAIVGHPQGCHLRRWPLHPAGPPAKPTRALFEPHHLIEDPPANWIAKDPQAR
jgi:Xaa-Pro aminopeptidase